MTLQRCLVSLLALNWCASYAHAHPIEVVRAVKLSANTPGFSSALGTAGRFGRSIRGLGDVDQDGRLEFAVGAWTDPGGGQNRGAVHIMSMDALGNAEIRSTIDSTHPLLAGRIADGDRFGKALANVGDLDGNGYVDLAVSSVRANSPFSDSGEIHILFLGPGFGVSEVTSFDPASLGVMNPATDRYLGISMDWLGDLDGDGLGTLAIGSEIDDGGVDRGGIWMVEIDSAGSPQSTSLIAGSTDARLQIDNTDYFIEATAIGDRNHDGVPDLAVSSVLDDDGDNPENGSVWLLDLNPDATILNVQKISETQGGFGGNLTNGRFGDSVAPLGDLDGNGAVDYAVTETLETDTGYRQGVIWILLMAPEGTVIDQVRIGEGLGGFPFALDDVDYMGTSIHSPGDLDGNGFADLMVGAGGDDDGGGSRGAVYVIYLGVPCAVDLNDDRIVDNGDIIAFISYIFAGDPRADMNGDGINDNGDINTFVSLFLEGCP